jgi:hypothetical protein
MIAMQKARLVKQQREAILRLAARHGARNLRLFGSAARGEDGPHSDIDFLVEMEPRHSSFFPGGLIADLEELLSSRVDVVTPAGLNERIRERVLREAIPL